MIKHSPNTLPLIAVLVWLFAAATQAASVSRQVAGHAPLRILIKPKTGVLARELAQLHAENHCKVLRRFPSLGRVEVLVGPAEQTPEGLVMNYQRSPLIEYAEPDYQIRLAGAFPNDPSFLDGTQWGLNNAGQDGGTPNADVDAPEAWGARNSASNVIVAIVDSGLRYTHEDLAANMWINPLDGTHGTNAFAGSTNPDDDYGHGTRIAGVIGAKGNNGVGVAGIAWHVQLMACKFTDQFGNSSVSDAIACLDYARANGASVVNASWGLDSFSLSLSNAVAALRDAGILVVAAAGNAAQDTDIVPHYPACYDLDNVISVMATTRRDEIYGLSNIGATTVDLAAPGDEIYSTGFQSNTAYAVGYGTSMAAAYVTGAAALLRAAHPAETPAQISARILAAVDPLPALNGACLSGGRLNLRKALGVGVSAPLLDAEAALADGEFLLGIAGDPGRTYIVETSTNLVQWWPATTNITGLDGSLTVTNTFDKNLSRRFFRALLVQ